MLKSAILSGCVIAICSSIVDYSVISEKLRKQIMSIISLILIIVVATKLLSIDADSLANELIHEYSVEYSNGQTVPVISEAVEEETVSKLCEYLYNGLQRLGIIAQDIRIELDISSDNLIEVSKTTIVLSKADNESGDKVKSFVSNELRQGEVIVVVEECDG